MRAYYVFDVLHACFKFYYLNGFYLPPRTDPLFLGTLKQILKSSEKGGLTSNVRWFCSPFSCDTSLIFRVLSIGLMLTLASHPICVHCGMSFYFLFILFFIQKTTFVRCIEALTCAGQYDHQLLPNLKRFPCSRDSGTIVEKLMAVF